MKKDEQQREVKRIRRERAEQLEMEALSAELDARQYTGAMTLPEKDRRPGLEDQAELVIARAEEKRDQANAAHQLAGTSAALFEAKHRDFISGRISALEIAILKEEEWIAHPDVYCDNPEGADRWLDERRWSIAELTMGLEVLAAKSTEVEKDAPTN